MSNIVNNPRVAQLLFFAGVAATTSVVARTWYRLGYSDGYKESYSLGFLKGMLKSLEICLEDETEAEKGEE